MHTFNISGSFEIEDQFEIELDEGEPIISDSGETYDESYALYLKVKYNYRVTTGIPYSKRAYAESYEEECEITDIILLEGFTWNGKTYKAGESVYIHSELLKFIDEDWIVERFLKKPMKS